MINVGDIFKFKQGSLLEGELFIRVENDILRRFHLEHLLNDKIFICSLKTGEIENYKINDLNNKIEIIKFSSRINIQIINPSNQKLQLVRGIKEITGWGLKEAKDYMDNCAIIDDYIVCILKNISSIKYATFKEYAVQNNYSMEFKII